MSRLQMFLRILIFAGALASVMNLSTPQYHLTRVSFDRGGWQESGLPVAGSQVLKLAFTAIGLSLL